MVDSKGILSQKFKKNVLIQKMEKLWNIYDDI